jgi:glycosyltransferase involved in cell wall biosynthesis
MKIGVLTVTLNEERLIGPCIRQFKPFGLKHVVIVNEYTQNGVPHEQDKTFEIAANNGAYVFKCDKLKETEQRNFGLEKLNDCDYIFIVDTDEFYTPDGIKKMIETASKSTNECYRNCNMTTFWKDYHHAVTGTTEYTFIVPKGVRFNDKRHIGSNHKKIDVPCYHLSYARTYDEMKNKIKTFSHAVEVSPDWLDKVWLNWKEGNTDLHPTNPPLWREAIRFELPSEIRSYFDENQIII